MMVLPLLALLLQTAGAPSPPSAPRTLRVGRGAPYASPAAAIAAAHRGDTIRVAAGVYPGALVIRQPLVLLGEPGATIDGERQGTTITIDADSVELRGFAIRRSGRSLDHDDAAIRLFHCVGCRIVGNRISEPLHGIYVLSSARSLLRDNDITGDPALTEAARGNGVHLYDAPAIRVEHNRIRGTRDGIYFGFSSGDTVVDNEVTDLRYGVHYMYSDDNLFAGNRFARNAAGAAIMFSKRVVFRDNVFADHVGYRAYGILLQQAETTLAERNRIEGNLTGMLLDGVLGSTFRENTIVGNGVGIELMASSELNVFAGNVISDNRVPVEKVLGSGDNAWTEGGRGNYWGDAAVFDLDGDGIGDRPYAAADPFTELAVSRPVLEAFTGTPAAMALSWAERAFPVFDFPRVEDPAPLVRAPRAAPQPAAVARTPGNARRTLAWSLALLLPLSLAGVARRARVVVSRRMR